MTVKPHDWKHVLWLALQLVLEPEFHRSMNLKYAEDEDFAVK